jgi:hypothetical protein
MALVRIKKAVGCLEYLLENGASVKYNASMGLWEAQNGKKYKAVMIGGIVAGFTFKKKWDSIDKQLFEMSEEGRSYLDYNNTIGGEPFGYTIGMPAGADPELYGGIAGMYRECIRRKITWEELLQWDGHSDELPL